MNKVRTPIRCIDCKHFSAINGPPAGWCMYPVPWWAEQVEPWDRKEGQEEDCETFEPKLKSWQPYT